MLSMLTMAIPERSVAKNVRTSNKYDRLFRQQLGFLFNLNCIFDMSVCLALVLVRPNGHLLSPELSSSFGSGGGGSVGSGGAVIRTGLYPRSTASTALHYAHSTPRVNAGDLTQPSLQAGQRGINTGLFIMKSYTKYRKTSTNVL